MIKQGTTIFVKNPENLSIKQSSMISFFLAKQPIKTSKKMMISLFMAVTNTSIIHLLFLSLHKLPHIFIILSHFSRYAIFSKIQKTIAEKNSGLCFIARKAFDYMCITIIKIVMIKRLNGSIKELSTAATERLYPQRSVYTGATLKIGPKTTNAKT